MNVTILSVDIKTIPTAKGSSYQKAEVAYKNNSFQGKVEGKSVMSFGATAGSFKTLSSAVSGDTYEVEVVKNTAGYNDWVSMTISTVGAPSPQAVPAGAGTINKPAGAVATRSTYESAEERAAKQVYIIRQSSISAAINTLTVGAKTVKPDDVITLATKYVDYVMGIKSKGASGFEDLPDFPESEFPQVE